MHKGEYKILNPSFKYLRFYSAADGWSDSAYAPDTKRRLGLGIIIR